MLERESTTLTNQKYKTRHNLEVLKYLYSGQQESIKAKI